MRLFEAWKTVPATALAIAACAACGTLHLEPADAPGGDGETAVASHEGLTLVAARSFWCEEQLSDVSTPLGITLLNESNQTVPVSLRQLSLVDERGEVYPALPPAEVIHALFGDAVATPPPGSEPPLRVPPPPPSDGVAPPGAPAAPPSIGPPGAPQSPEPPPHEQQTLAPAAPLDILLVGGSGHHAGGGVGGGHGSAGPSAGPGAPT